jgi:hypothetical protein
MEKKWKVKSVDSRGDFIICKYDPIAYLKVGAGPLVKLKLGLI